MSEFEKQVRIALIQQGKTLTNLASELGISVSYLYEIIRGTRKAEEQKQKIRTLLGLDMETNEQNVNQSNCETNECQ
jgi:transcriptional regulator with XRE-family HTH domain